MRHLQRKSFPPVHEASPGSLAAALAQVPDPRRPFGWRRGCEPLPLVGMLQMSVAALLCGAQSLLAIAQWGRERREDAPEVLIALGLPPGRSPSVATLHRLFRALDVNVYEQVLGQWLRQTGVTPTEALAIDGKTLRGVPVDPVPGRHLVAAYAHEAQVILLQVATVGKGHELAGVRQLLSQRPLSGRVITGDALLTQRDLCTTIVAAHGNYLFPVKENQPELLKDCQDAFSPLARSRT